MEMKTRRTCDWNIRPAEALDELYSVEQHHVGHIHQTDAAWDGLLVHAVAAWGIDPVIQPAARQVPNRFRISLAESTDNWVTLPNGNVRNDGADSIIKSAETVIVPHVGSVPMVADVLRVMRDLDCSQDTAVIVLGGTP